MPECANPTPSKQHIPTRPILRNFQVYVTYVFRANKIKKSRFSSINSAQFSSARWFSVSVFVGDPKITFFLYKFCDNFKQAHVDFFSVSIFGDRRISLFLDKFCAIFKRRLIFVKIFVEDQKIKLFCDTFYEKFKRTCAFRLNFRWRSKNHSFPR